MKIFVGEQGRLRSGWRFLLAAIAFLLTQWMAYAIAHKSGGSEYRFEAVFRPVSLVLVLAAFSFLEKFADSVAGNPLEAQGLTLRDPAPVQAVGGLVIGGTMVVLCVSAIVIFGNYRVQLVQGGGGLIAPVLWILLTAAMLEEVTFRGYPFQRLIEGIGPAAATAISALLFGCIHLLNPSHTALGFINTALIGAMFSLAYLKSGALWLSFGIHFGWNVFLGSVFGLPVSGISMFSVATRGQVQGPSCLTGSAYGVEGSITCTAVVLLAVAGLFFWRRGEWPGASNERSIRF
jgi:membrane protease YdiL (CAAX protease family)